MKKRILSLVLAVLMIATLLPVSASADSVEYAMFPGDVVYVTQGAWGSYSHSNQNAFDLANNSNYRAPFSGTITQIKTSYNAVVLQSDNKVM